MSDDLIKLETATDGMRGMAEIMAPGTQVYREKAKECEELRSLLVKSEARVAFLEEELSKERMDKERWINDSLLFRDMATRQGAILQFIILSASRLKTAMSKISELPYITFMRSILQDTLAYPQDPEQQKLVNSATQIPDTRAVTHVGDVKIDMMSTEAVNFGRGCRVNGDIMGDSAMKIIR